MKKYRKGNSYKLDLINMKDLDYSLNGSDNEKEYFKTLKVIEHKLQSNLKEYEIGFCKERKITWKSVTKTSIDTKRLREELPEVVDGYLKTSTSRVFRIGR